MRRPGLMDLLRALAGRWRWMTLAALLACAVTVRLGFWQLDRLAQRRALSAELTARFTAEPIVLTEAGLGPGTDPEQMLYRRVLVRGTFDHNDELALTNEVWGGRLGLHLITPLVLAGSDRAVLVDRGWIPLDEAGPASWARYRTFGPVEVEGWIRPSQHARGPVRGANAAGTQRLIAALDVPQIQPLVSHQLLPFVVVQLPDDGRLVQLESLPYRKAPATDLGDGVHLIAAVQWFIISGIIVAGQIIYVMRHMEARPDVQGTVRGPSGRTTPGQRSEAALTAPGQESRPRQP
jgi:surfeit locus 1 family protein